MSLARFLIWFLSWIKTWISYVVSLPEMNHSLLKAGLPQQIPFFFLVGLPRLMDLIGFQAALEYISLNLIDYSIDNQT